MLKRTRWIVVLTSLAMMVTSGALVTRVSAENPVRADAVPRSIDLLDRGTATPQASGFGPSPMMATLASGPGATPGITMVSVVGSASMAGGPAFFGNFYIAPTDFPSSWYPFDVTGVYAWQNSPPSPPGDLILGAGVAPGPFAGDMGTMWAAFGTARVPVPAFMTPSVIGAPGNLASPLPMPAGTPLLGVACGLYTEPSPGGPLLGAIVPPSSPKQAQTFNGPPLGADVLVPEPAIGLFVQWVAGCYVSGATVPVELQSFHIE